MTSASAVIKFRHALRDSVTAALRATFLRDRRYFYGHYLGSDQPALLFLKNLFRPVRFLTKLAYGQVMPLPAAVSLATRVDHVPNVSVEWSQYMAKLKRDGIVFIPGLFKQQAENLCVRYRVNASAFPPNDQYQRFNVDLSDPELFSIATNEALLAILADYYGCQPFLRHLPGINCTNPASVKARESIGFNNYWHYDTPNQTTAHILLKDVAVSDSCMFYAKGSHRTHRVQLSSKDYYYSEQYVRERFEIVPCIGEAGTVVLFDSNGVHRVDLKPGTFRAHVHLNFVPGNHIIRFKPNVPSGFPPLTPDALAALSPLQRRSLDRVLQKA